METQFLRLLSCLFTLSILPWAWAEPPMSPSEFVSKFEQALETRNLAPVEWYLTAIKDQTLRESDFLRLLKKASEPTSPPCFFNAILGEMDRRFPSFHIGSLFFANGAIKEKGLKIILDQAVPKSDQKADYTISNSYTSLTEAFKKSVLSNKSHGIFFHENENAHWTLVYLNRHLKNESCVIQILDSVGHEQVIRIKQQLQGQAGNCQFALEKDRRQYDTTTCSVFAITDFLELRERDDQLHEIKNPSPKVPDRNYFLRKLAPELLKLAQPNPFPEKDTEFSVHDTADHTLVTLPKQHPINSPFDEDAFKTPLCQEDRKTYFNFNQVVQLNPGSKILHDQYVLEILEYLIQNRLEK